MSRRRRLAVQIDERADKLPEHTLGCRGFFHAWVQIPVAPARFRDLAARGHKEIILECGCGTRWIRLFDRTNGEVLEQRREYPKDYLLPPGSGRLSKSDARKTLWAREDEELYR